MNFPSDSSYYLDKGLVRQAFNSAAPHYDEAAVLQHEIAQRLLDRLDFLRVSPEQIYDIGAGTGYLSRGLAARYGDAHITSLDLAYAMSQQARHNFDVDHRVRQSVICGDAESLPLATDSSDMLFSSSTIQWCNDLKQVFTEFSRVLKSDGLIMFSTFGPDTLKELRQSWAEVDDEVHVNAFIDMHDIGDIMKDTGFKMVVLDTENITLTYDSVTALMKDLKVIGAHNVNSGRSRTLTSRKKIRQLMAAYEQFRDDDGRLPATYEVVYGHAWLANAKEQKQEANAPVHIPLEQFRRRLRSGGR